MQNMWVDGNYMIYAQDPNSGAELVYLRQHEDGRIDVIKNEQVQDYHYMIDGISVQALHGTEPFKFGSVLQNGNIEWTNGQVYYRHFHIEGAYRGSFDGTNSECFEIHRTASGDL